VAIKDNRLKEFFSKQKVGAFDSLVQKGKPTAQKPPTIEPETTFLPETKKSLVDVALVIEERTLPSATPPKAASFVASNDKITQNVSIESFGIDTLAKCEQSVSEPLTYSEHTVSNTLTNSEQIVSKPLYQPLANALANSAEIQFTDLMLFSKKERELLSLIFWQCRNNGTLVSPPITTEEIRNTLKITADRVRNLIFRIIKKGGLKIVQHKNGQTAYRVFELPKSLYQVMIDFQSNNVPRFMDPLANTLAKPLAKPLANTTYSSSINNKYTTTSIPEDWKKINFAVLEHIGFSETQLLQLHSGNVTSPEIVQDAINRFAYSLQYNDKTKTYGEPLSVLMGVLRKGQRWVEPNYVPPKELALRQILEEKKKKKEQFDGMIKELIDLEFPEWKRKLTEEQIKQIVPADTLKVNSTAAIYVALRGYFTEKILLPRLEAENILID